MKVVVIGGTGLIGRALVEQLTTRGHDVNAASPESGVDTLKGKGLAEAFAGADVVVDVSNSPSHDDEGALSFFQTSARNIVKAAEKAKVAHLIALSIVGTSRLQASGYFRGKAAQEKAFSESGLPYTIVQATETFEFIKTLPDTYTKDGVVRLPTFALQPIASSDIAVALTDTVLAKPRGGVVEIAGPERKPLDEFVAAWLDQREDPRPVQKAMDAKDSRYFGVPVDDSTLVPGDGARVLPTRFEAWVTSPEQT